ncbi:MAG: aminotransferase class IV [Rikenellaceae bacterium]
MSDLYIYKIINVLDAHPLHLKAHCDDLANYSAAIFGEYRELDFRRIESAIISKIEQYMPDVTLSIYAELRIYSDGREEIELSSSIYRGYVLRAMPLVAALVKYDLLMGEYPTLAQCAQAHLANIKVRREGAEVAIRESSEGLICSANGSPLFGVKGYTLYAPHSVDSLERSLTISAAQSAGMDVVELDIRSEHLMFFDELFYADHYGLTPIASLGERLYMSIMAEKIADQMNQK